MTRKNHKHYRDRLDFVLICCMSSSLLTMSYALPTSVLASPLHSRHFIIAKSPDERQPEAVEKGIEQIPVVQPSVSQQRKESIESPLPPATTPTATGTTSAPKPAATGSSSTPTATGTTSAPKPGVRLSTPPSQGGRQPVTGGSPISTSITSTFREINFVDLAFGVLAPGDYQSQGRYFHFYQFEGRENQLIQIRLTGSADQRRSNNLSLNPFLLLLDSNNQVLVKRGTGEAVDSRGVKDAFIFVRLPAKGTYTIAVTSQNSKEKGRYSLALRNDRASYTLDQSSELTLENSTLRQNGSPYNVSKFQGKKDQLVSIRVDSIFEQFSPYVVLLNSKGQIVASDSDKDGKYSALIDRARLPADDTYYIVVISANAQERGTYRLTMF